MLYNAAKLLLFCELSKYFNTFCYLCRKFLVMKISKNRYLQGFLVVVLLLALVRVIFPSVAEPRLTAHSDGKDSTAIDSLRGDLMASAGAQDELSVTPDTASDGSFSIFFHSTLPGVKSLCSTFWLWMFAAKWARALAIEVWSVKFWSPVSYMVCT